MKFLVLLVLSLPAQAAVENVLSMQREEGGTFSVVCEIEKSLYLIDGVQADAIRGNEVCSQIPRASRLEAGLYTNPAGYCDQMTTHSGDEIQLILSAPCEGTLTLTKFQKGWYRGVFDGFTYEVEVKSNTRYVFYSRDFRSYGEFNKAEAPTLTPSAKSKGDPVVK